MVKVASFPAGMERLSTRYNNCELQCSETLVAKCPDGLHSEQRSHYKVSFRRVGKTQRSVNVFIESAVPLKVVENRCDDSGSCDKHGRLTRTSLSRRMWKAVKSGCIAVK